MARILLIKGIDPSFKVPATAFPLGLMNITSMLKRAHGERHEHRLFDLRMPGHGPDRLDEVVREFCPDIVGMSGLTQESVSLNAAAQAVKRIRPKVPVILGGPHATSVRARALDDCAAIDYVAYGEGEQTWVDFVEAIERGERGMDAIPGLISRRASGEHADGGAREVVKDLDTLPWPDYELAEPTMDLYWKQIIGSPTERRGERFMTLFTSRACPYKCTYCHTNFGKGFNAYSAENVIEHMGFLHEKYGITKFSIADDIFNWNRERTRAICRGIIERGWGKTFHIIFANGLRTDILDREDVRLLGEAGTGLLSVAVESATPRIQKYIRKNLKLDRVKQVVEWCDEFKIMTRGFFMLGFPGETREEIHATVDWALRSKLHSAFFFLVIPFEGTALHDQHKELVEELGIETHNVSYWRGDFSMAEIETDELNRIRLQAVRRFYLSPWRIARLLRHGHLRSLAFNAWWVATRLVLDGWGWGGKSWRNKQTEALPQPAAGQ